MQYAKDYTAKHKKPRPIKMCAHCGVEPARILFCSDKCRGAAADARHPRPMKPCARPGCENLARVKYCSATCRATHYNERRSLLPCGLTPAPRRPRRCSLCDSLDHDWSRCPKRGGPS